MLGKSANKLSRNSADRTLSQVLRSLKFLAAYLLFTAACAVLPAPGAYAASTDTINLIVSPFVNYGVTISSVNLQGYDFGTVDLNSVTHSTAAIVVQNTGNVTCRWQLKATDSANWQASTSEGHDAFVLMGVFTSTASAVQVNPSEFSDSQDEILTAYQYPSGTTNAGKYNAGVDMNSIPPAGRGNSKRNLWLKLKMPTTSSVATQQEMRVYVTATP